MSELPTQPIPRATQSFNGLKPIELILYPAFACAAAFQICRRILTLWLPDPSVLSEPLLLFSGLGLVVSSMGRSLPGQVVTVLLLGCVILGAGLDLLTGAVMNSSGPQSLQKLCAAFSWTAPFTKALVLLSARGAAQAALRPWRNRSNTYGFWLLAGSVILATSLEWVLSVAPEVSSQWVGVLPRILTGWSYASAALLTNCSIYLLLTPWFVKTRPGASSSNLGSLVVWTALFVLFVAPW